MQRRKFSSWTRDEVIDTFGLLADLDGDTLVDWTNSRANTSAEENNALELLREKLILKSSSWNEDELKNFFISPLFALVKFDDLPRVDLFMERSLVAKSPEFELYGEADFLIAHRFKGLPAVPYFFFQEMKRERGSSGDPEGQMMSEMIAAQILNGADRTIYGAFNIGRQFFFGRLTKKNYAVSNAFDAGEAATLLQILRILKQLKEYIRLQIDSGIGLPK